ncbi:MAG: hypothetical protein OIN87_04255 [Candidatus Methanoperedens sp.]|nr:hypothetical protein [Candidatus Methanoperedens sp.]
MCTVLFLTGNSSAEGFASSEAGIAAYVNVGMSIDLDQAAGTYRGIEDRTSTYIIGIVDVPNANDYEMPHVYTTSDGWVMAYYPKEKPRALIMPWGQFDKNTPDISQLSNSRLEEAIAKVSGVNGIEYSTIKPNTKYYDFQYPDANRLTMIARSSAIDGVQSFRFRVPTEITLYDTSWEYYSYGSEQNGRCSRQNSLFKLDGNELIGTNGSFNHNSRSDGGNGLDERYYGTINGLTKDVLHKGDLWYYQYYNNPNGCAYGPYIDAGSSNIAIAVIYKAP